MSAQHPRDHWQHVWTTLIQHDQMHLIKPRQTTGPPQGSQHWLGGTTASFAACLVGKVNLGSLDNRRTSRASKPSATATWPASRTPRTVATSGRPAAEASISAAVARTARLKASSIVASRGTADLSPSPTAFAVHRRGLKKPVATATLAIHRPSYYYKGTHRGCDTEDMCTGHCAAAGHTYIRTGQATE